MKTLSLRSKRMVLYRIVISKQVRKDFKRIPKEQSRRILSAIQELSESPRPPGCKKLKGDELYRIRVGIYRVVFEIRDSQLIVIVVRVGHRKKIYRT